MPQYVTDLQVSLNESQEEELHAQGFIKINVDLNKGAGGKHTYLWYKKGDSGAITRIQFSFSDDISEGLTRAGYHNILKNLNPVAGGNPVYLWFSKGSSEYHVPIVNLDVSTTDEAQKFKFGWERLACDLSRKAGGHQVFLSVKRENPTYISDLAVTAYFQGDDDYFNDGYIRVDEDTNKGAAGGDHVFIWYRQTKKREGAIRDLQVSTNDAEAQGFQKQGYHPFNISLNQGTGGNPVHLWYKKHGISSDPIKDVTQVITREAAEKFQAAGVEVINKNLNTGVKNAPALFLCYHR